MDDTSINFWTWFIHYFLLHFCHWFCKKSVKSIHKIEGDEVNSAFEAINSLDSCFATSTKWCDISIHFLCNGCILQGKLSSDIFINRNLYTHTLHSFFPSTYCNLQQPTSWLISNLIFLKRNPMFRTSKYIRYG